MYLKFKFRTKCENELRVSTFTCVHMQTVSNQHFLIRQIRLEYCFRQSELHTRSTFTFYVCRLFNSALCIPNYKPTVFVYFILHAHTPIPYYIILKIELSLIFIKQQDRITSLLHRSWTCSLKKRRHWFYTACAMC